jgi:hypothetical protein
MKSLSFDFTTGAQSPATQVPSIKESVIAGPATTAQPVPNQTSRFFPQVPQPTTTYPGGPFPAGNANDNAWIDDQWKQAAANWKPGMQWNGPQNMLPTSIRQTPAAPVAGPIQPQAPAPLSEKEKRQQMRQNSKENKRNSLEEANRRAIEQIQNASQGYAYGGQYFQPGGENQQVLGLPANPQFDTSWAPIGQTNVQMSQEFNKQKYGEPIMTNTPESNFRATYDKNKKSNPFFAPAMLAGLNTLAGAAQNRDAKQKENQLRNKLSYDQIYTANPETSGNRGDWTANEGYFRPNDMVPTQFTGAGMQMQWGGAYSEGDELYLDEDAIQAFLQAGGQLDYLD